MWLRKAARSLVRITMMLVLFFESKHKGGNKEGCVCVCMCFADKAIGSILDTLTRESSKILG